MAERRKLSCYEYVTVPYEQVRDALRTDSSGLLQRATQTATGRARDLAATLHVTVGPLEIGAEVRLVVRSVTERISALGQKVTLVDLSWTAARGAGLFPAMEASLSVYALSRHETQLELIGRYQPPLGIVGHAIDAAIGHRVAEASVLRFVQEVAARLKAEHPG